MQVVKHGIADVGLARILVGNGKSDITFLIENEFIESVRNILTSMNHYFETVIKECSIRNVVTLPNFITKASFFVLEKYYSGGIIKLTFNNVYEVIEISSFVKDDDLLRICSQYIENKISQENFIEILNNFTSLQLKTRLKLKILNDNLQSFVLDNTHFILKNLLSFTPQSVIYLFQIPDIKLPSESQMIHNLIKYFINSKTNKDKMKKYKSRLLQCYMNYYGENCRHKLLAIRNCDFRDIILLKLYNINKKVVELNEDEKRILQNVNISQQIDHYSSYGTSSLEVTTILIIILYEMNQMKPESAPINDIYLNCLYDVFYNNETTNAMKNSIAKLLSIHIMYGKKDNYSVIIKRFKSDEFCYRLLLFDKILSKKYIQLIIDNVTTFNENLIKSICIENIKLKQEIIEEMKNKKSVIDLDIDEETDDSVEELPQSSSSDDEKLELNKGALMKLKEKKKKRRKTSRRKFETEIRVMKYLRNDSGSNSSFDGDFINTRTNTNFGNNDKNKSQLNDMQTLQQSTLSQSLSPLKQQSKQQQQNKDDEEKNDSVEIIEEEKQKNEKMEEEEDTNRKEEKQKEATTEMEEEKEEEKYQQPIDNRKDEKKDEDKKPKEPQSMEEEIEENEGKGKENGEEMIKIKSEKENKRINEISPQSVFQPAEVQEITEDIKNTNLLLKKIYDTLHDEAELKPAFEIEKDPKDNYEYLTLPEIYKRINSYYYTSPGKFFFDLFELYKTVYFKKCDRVNGLKLQNLYKQAVDLVDIYKNEPSIYQQSEEKEKSPSTKTKRNRESDINLGDSGEFTYTVEGEIVKRKRNSPLDQLNNIFSAALSRVIAKNQELLSHVMDVPDLSIYPLFPKVIKNPVYISTIKARIEKRAYTRRYGFINDFIKLKKVFGYFSPSNKSDDEFDAIYTDLESILNEYKDIKDLEEMINQEELEAPRKHRKMDESNDSIDSQDV